MFVLAFNFYFLLGFFFYIWLPICGTSKKLQGKLPKAKNFRRDTLLRPKGKYEVYDAKKHTKRFRGTTTVSTTKKWRPGKTIDRPVFEEKCDYLAYYCLTAYDTGEVCARTHYTTYRSFKNYCMLDYANCMERYEVWFPVYLGKCTNVHQAFQMEHYHYQEDFFLDQILAIEK